MGPLLENSLRQEKLHSLAQFKETKHFVIRNFNLSARALWRSNFLAWGKCGPPVRVAELN